MSDDWTDVDDTNAATSSFVSCSTPTSRRAKLHLTILSLIDRKAVNQQIQALRHNVYQPFFEQVLVEIADYALEVYLEKTQEKVQLQELDYKTIQRKTCFEVSSDEDGNHRIALRDKPKLVVRVSKHLDKLCRSWKIQLHENLEQEVAQIIAALTLTSMEDTQGLDSVEVTSSVQIKRLFNQYFNQRERKHQLQEWYGNQIIELAHKNFEQIGLEKLSIEELEYFLGLQSELQLYRRLRQILQSLGFALGEQIQNFDKAVALFRRTNAFNSFKNQPGALYQRQSELENLLKVVESPLFKNGATEPVFTGLLPTSIVLALLDPAKWRIEDVGENQAFAAQLIMEMVVVLLSPPNVSLASPYSKSCCVRLILFERFWYSTLRPLIHSDEWESLDRDEGFVLARFNPKTTQKRYTLSYQMLPLYGQDWDVQTILNTIFYAPKHLGVEVAKIHLIFCAYTSRNTTNSSFCLKGSDLIQTLGWTKNKERSRSELLNQLAQYTLVLSWLNFISPWDTDFSYRCLNHPVWNVDIKKITETNLLGEEIQEILIQVQPKAWVKPLLKKLHCANDNFSQNVCFLKKEWLEIDSYHHRLSAKLAFYRSLHRSIYQPGRFKTSNLLNLLGEHVEEASEIDLSGLVTSLEKLADLGFSVSSLKDRESLRDYLILQPPKVDSQAIKRWKRLIQRNQRSDLPEQGAITGAQLKEARLRSGLTLEQVAKRVQFSSSKLSKIENGYVSPSPSDRKKLREFFDLL
ncbi:hypothetical protein LEP3755_45030 [Leptolyngbya sp. NIES-3755]|nr:hypothetical protein LEP3755_45030 [Leptolyngbya sp. NIES-3755]